MKKQLSKISFLALSFLVIGVNAYAQVTHNKTLKLEGTRQIIAGARRSALSDSILDDVLSILFDFELKTPYLQAIGQRT